MPRTLINAADTSDIVDRDNDSLVQYSSGSFSTVNVCMTCVTTRPRAQGSPSGSFTDDSRCATRSQSSDSAVAIRQHSTVPPIATLFELTTKYGRYSTPLELELCGRS